MNENDAVIIGAVRTPVGKRNGALSGWHPADLAAETLSALVQRTGIDPSRIDDVIFGCVTSVGRQGRNIARHAVLAAGLPESVPATTVDRQCGSSQQAAHFAAQGVIAGAYDVVIAGGVEVMSSTPLDADVVDADPAGGRVALRYEDRNTYGESGLVGQGLSAEHLAERFDLSRQQLDCYAVESHRRAAAARSAGAFDNEIHPVCRSGTDSTPGEPIAEDEGIRSTTSEAILRDLRPVFRPDGRITAGNSSQISDGAAALLITSLAFAKSNALTPLARFHTFAVSGDDPVAMLTGPLSVTPKLLERAQLGLDDVDVWEVNEAFAAVPLSWLARNPVDPARVNPLGGAIALGHPLGCSGARIMTTLVHHLHSTGKRFGAQVMCERGGMANGTLIEALS